MNCDRVTGFNAVYAVITRNEYVNIIIAVPNSRSRSSTTGDNSLRKKAFMWRTRREA